MTTPLREVLARFGFRIDGAQQLDRTDRRVSGVTAGIRRMVAAAGGAATVYAFGRFISSTIRMGDDLDKTAQQIGMTVQELQAFRHAANLSGVDAQGFANAMGQLQLKAQQAARDGGAQARIFSDLGIEIRDASGELLSGSDLLRNVADAMRRTENPTQRTAAAMELMGRSGRRMLPMLTGGREGLARMEAELARLGGGASQEFVRQSVELTDEMTRMQMSMTSLRSSLAVALLPAISRGVQWFTRFAASLSRTGAAAELVKPVAVALGAALVTAGVSAAIAWGAAIVPILLYAAGAAALYLILDELVGIQNGNATATEELIAAFTGAERAAEIMESLRASISAVGDAIVGTTVELGRMLGLVPDDTVETITHTGARTSMVRSPRAGESEAAAAARGAAERAAAFRAAHTSPITGRRAREEREAIALSRARLDLITPSRAPIVGGNVLATPTTPAPRSVTVHDNHRTEVHVTAAEDPEATARVVNRELDRRDARERRAALEAVEPARAGG